MSFWTDAGVLGEAGIPSVIFGPTGKGLHSVAEYVVAEDVRPARPPWSSWSEISAGSLPRAVFIWRYVAGF